MSRTVHKAKGAEFDNVLLLLKDEKDIGFIINPNIEGNEEHRINYVAISRAKKRLFICVPSLSQENETQLKVMFDIINI